MPGREAHDAPANAGVNDVRFKPTGSNEGQVWRESMQDLRWTLFRTASPLPIPPCSQGRSSDILRSCLRWTTS